MISNGSVPLEQSNHPFNFQDLTLPNHILTLLKNEVTGWLENFHIGIKIVQFDLCKPLAVLINNIPTSANVHEIL